jgi:hypothetical protein
MRGAWRALPVDGSDRPVPGLAAGVRIPETRTESEAVTAAIVGFVVALVTSLGVSIACFAYLR